MSARVRILVSTITMAMVAALLVLLPAPAAYAAYEYNCGAHRGAQCHSEPRAEQSSGANCYGRCGPGCSWTVLGNAYTNACANHDSCVRGRLAAGASGWSAHSQCAGSLPAAVASFGQTHWNNWFQHARDSWSGLWTKVRNCCG